VASGLLVSLILREGCADRYGGEEGRLDERQRDNE